MQDKFEAFIKDKEAPAMYITGIAGTGKTTSLKKLVNYLASKGKNVVVCAHTHKAVQVLREKLDEHTNVRICTLHSFLKKRPTVNLSAKEVREVEGNKQVDTPDIVDFVFLDEFSMVGEKDYVDIQSLQYFTEEQIERLKIKCELEGKPFTNVKEGDIATKFIYVGDPNQLPPVKDVQVVYPEGKYQVKLEVVHRQANGNLLIDTLTQLNSFINGAEPTGLLEHSTFERNVDIVDKYLSYKTDNKIILAYTNAKVEELNTRIQGRDIPEPGDILFCPTNRKKYTLLARSDFATSITNAQDTALELGSRYKTLETINELEGIMFLTVADEEDKESTKAVIFGNASYMEKQEKLASSAVAINKIIQNKYPDIPLKDWVQANWREPLAISRKEAWKNYLSFKDFVVCMDFAHAMTIHKSQGSTYDYVFLDTKDIEKCSVRDYTMYLRLLYVAISRAAEKVYTN